MCEVAASSVCFCDRPNFGVCGFEQKYSRINEFDKEFDTDWRVCIEFAIDQQICVPLFHPPIQGGLEMFVKCTRMFVKDFEIELCIINLVNINILLFVVARPQATTCCNSIRIMREACDLQVSRTS